MPTEEGKVARKRANSKSEMNEFKLEFEEIKDEFKKLRDMYLGPLLETNGRISNQLKKMEDDVNRYSVAIEECQREIAELRQTANASQSAKVTQIGGVHDLVREATLQIKNCKQLFITNGEKEEKAKETLNDILKREAKIDRIIDLSKRKSRDGKKVAGKEGSFIVQMTSEKEQDEVMRLKAQYLKDAKSQMGINRSRTRMQRNEERKKINGKKLAGGSGDRQEVQKKVGAGMCRYGMECRRKDCKFDHPSDAESQIQNEIEED